MAASLDTQAGFGVPAVSKKKPSHPKPKEKTGLPQGDVYVFGWGKDGQLGLGQWTTSKNTPTVIKALQVTAGPATLFSFFLLLWPGDCGSLQGEGLHQIVMAYVVMACVVMTPVAMACVVMAYIVMASGNGRRQRTRRR